MIRGRLKGTAERWPHGVRARYVAGCRCDDCKRVNREYVAKRTREAIYGRTNRMIDAGPTRAHLLALRKAGLGRRAVALASGVRGGTIQAIGTGAKATIRETTAAKILAVTTTAKLGGALIDAAPTWRLIEALRLHGFTEEKIATRLGQTAGRLQIRRAKVTLDTARCVELLYRELTGADPSSSQDCLLREGP